MRGWIGSSMVLGGIVLAGCNGQTASSPAAPLSQNAVTGAAAPVQAAPATQPIAVPANAAPDQVVTVFLNALRSGDSPTTESLLTSKAREELAKHSMSVDVQSAPNATYQIRTAEVLADNPSGAHVSSVWTEKFDDGDETYEIVWVLRRQSEGWRVAGMAMQLIPEQQPQFLNFENPEDMLKKKEEAMAMLQAAHCRDRSATAPRARPCLPSRSSASRRNKRRGGEFSDASFRASNEALFRPVLLQTSPSVPLLSCSVHVLAGGVTGTSRTGCCGQ